MPILTITCGIPGSGKTSWAMAECERKPDVRIKLISSDEVRRFVTGSYGDSEHDRFVLNLCQTIVEHFLDFGFEVIYDATNPTPVSRELWVGLASRLGIPIRCVWVDTPLDICLSRNSRRENIVPDSVIRRIHDVFVPPGDSEGFYDVIRIKGVR